MSMNKYIVSGQGFLKESHFDRDEKKQLFTWTRTLRDAKQFKSKGARLFIESNNLDAFIWNPFSEEPVKNKWRVVRRSKHHDFFNDEDHEVLEWMVQLVMMESNSDAKYLATNKNSNPETLYDIKEEAEEVAKEKNHAILIELQKKMGLTQV